MSRCPYCDKILPDDWVKHNGAALMGKARGKRKARISQKASRAALTRWGTGKCTDEKTLRLREEHRSRAVARKLKIPLGICGRCGVFRPRGGTVVHHIDGDPTNKAIENLKEVCRPCHAALHAHFRTSSG